MPQARSECRVPQNSSPKKLPQKSGQPIKHSTAPAAPHITGVSGKHLIAPGPAQKHLDAILGSHLRQAKGRNHRAVCDRLAHTGNGLVEQPHHFLATDKALMMESAVSACER